jgi:hypothetical protein
VKSLPAQPGNKTFPQIYNLIFTQAVAQLVTRIQQKSLYLRNGLVRCETYRNEQTGSFLPSEPLQG